MEDARTLAAVAALQAGDFAAAGRHMTASHMSLKHDFQVKDNWDHHTRFA